MRIIRFYLIAISLAIFSVFPINGTQKDSKKSIDYSAESLSRNIDIAVNVQPELFPVIAKFLSEGNRLANISDLVKWDFYNHNSDSVQISITSEIPEWTSPVISTIYLAPNENKKLTQTPFGINLLNNNRTVPTTIILTAKVEGEVCYQETKNLKIRSADDMIWSLNTPWDTEELIAAWVTPNDESVESILSIAKQRIFNHTLAGYRSSDLVSEIREIFNAVRNSKVAYVNSTMSFGKIGFTQRVRLPKESITLRSANCIDGAVLFASLFENIGLEPVIVLIPGHAFVGVRTSPNSQQIWFIETTLVGRSVWASILSLKNTFNAAVEEGSREFTNSMQTNPESVHIIDIKNARRKGIYPLW